MTTSLLKELTKNGFSPDGLNRLPEINPIERELRTYSALFQILVEGGVSPKNAANFVSQLVEKDYSNKHDPNAPLNIHHLHALFVLNNVDVQTYFPGSRTYITQIDRALLRYTKKKAPQLFASLTK